MKDYVNIVTIFQGWHVSSMDGKNWGVSIMEEILSSLPFWEEMEETKNGTKSSSKFRFAILKFDKY